LQKDITELERAEITSLFVEKLSALSVVLAFSEAYNCGASMPCNFLVCVPKYYPHSCPSVKCLDYGMESFNINRDGFVSHQVLTEWSPVKSLLDVVHLLHDVRNRFSENSSISSASASSSGISVKYEEAQYDDSDDMQCEVFR